MARSSLCAYAAYSAILLSATAHARNTQLAASSDRGHDLGLPAPALRSDAGPGRAGVDRALECGLRALALDFAQFLQPQADNALVYDALRLGADCNASRPPPARAAPRRVRPRASAGATFFADAAKGDDGNACTESAPFLTIYRGLHAKRRVTPAAAA
jgi:hypothetical protein